jgi:nucleotide-binding universal stress UspA family protein
MTPAFKKIMCAVDFSEFSSGVIHAGQEMARRFGATLFVFHSVCFPKDRVSDVFDKTGARGEKASVRRVEEKIDALMKGAAVPWEPVIMIGDPVENGVLAARRKQADLVMAASYGMSGLKRFFLGTVVERLSGLLAVPLMVLRHGGGADAHPWEERLGIKRIAVCCALTPGSRDLVEYGLTLAGGWRAELILLHALEAPPGEDDIEPELCSYEAAQEHRQERTRARLENLAENPRQTVKVGSAVLCGVPGEQVLRFIESTGVDLVVVGGPKHGSPKAFTSGSTTRFLIRHAPCPVFSVALR